MDNNLNTNNGVNTNTNETPTPTFNSLYGDNSTNQPVQNPTPMPNQMNNVAPTPMPNTTQPVNPQPMTQPVNTQNMANQQPIQPQINNVEQNIQPAFTQTENVQPLNVETNLNQTPNVQPMPNQMNVQNVTGEQPINPQPMNTQQNDIIEESTPVQNVINNQQQTNQMPNPGVIMTPNNDLSNTDIDKDRMQSIEEQLSKTSQYNPEDLQQEKITIPTDNQYEKNKSGLTFVIILFVILAVVIALLPQITKWLS